MRGWIAAGLVGLAGLSACSSSSAEQRADAPPGKGSVGQSQTQAPPPPGAGTSVSPMSTGRQKVKGGESFSLRGPTMITVAKVLYLNQPCPPAAECIHSGIIKTVEFEVSREGAPQQQASVPMGSPKVVEGVQLQVFDVQPGPTADIEASLPVMGVPLQGGGAGH